MKKSVKCILGVLFVLMFAITSTAFGADLAVPKTSMFILAQNAHTNIIKIDPNVIKKTEVSFRLVELKRRLKVASDKVAELNSQIPALEQHVRLLAQKEAECMNKPFTHADVSAAGCSNDMNECSRRLYDMCRRAEGIEVSNGIHRVQKAIGQWPTGSAAGGVIQLHQSVAEFVTEWRAGLWE